MATLAWAPGAAPVALRVEATFHAVGRSPRSALDDRFEVPSIAGSLVIGSSQRALRRVRPYLLFGGGAFNTTLGPAREWHLGLSAGLGAEMQLGALRWFGEVRAQQVQDGSPTRLFPVSVGLLF